LGGPQDEVERRLVNGRAEEKERSFSILILRSEASKRSRRGQGGKSRASKDED
jgi:hypothetical protein